MSLQYPSGSNQAVVSHESELIPHDPIIPDDFLAPEVPDGDNDHDCSTPGSSSNNHLGLASRMQYQRQIVESYGKLEPQLVVPYVQEMNTCLYSILVSCLNHYQMAVETMKQHLRTALSPCQFPV